MKKYVKESVNEEVRPKRAEVIVDHYFYEVTEYLRRRVFPKLNDDDLYKLNLKLRDWFIENT